MFRSRVWWLGAAALAMLIVAASRAVVQEPVIVITVQSTDALIDDIKYVLSSTGKPELANTVDSTIDQATLGKGFAGLDRTKPFGLYVTVGASGAPEFTFFFPVTDKAAFPQTLTRVIEGQLQVKGDQFSIRTPEESYFGKFGSGHCFVSPLPAALQRLPDPSKLVNTNHGLTIEAALGKISDDVKDGLIEQLEGLAIEVEERFGQPQENPNDPAAQPPQKQDAAAQKIRDTGMKFVMDMLRIVLKESTHLSAGVDLDRQSKTLKADVSVVAKPGTNLAHTLAGYEQSTSEFSALVGPDTTASVMFAMPMSSAAREVIRELINSATEQAHAAIDRSERLKTTDQKKTAHDLLDRVVKFIHATGDKSETDGVIVLNSFADGKSQVVAAGKITQGDELAKSLEEAITQSTSATAREKLKLDVDKHGGARIHSIQLEAFADRDGPLGTGPAHLAIRNDAVFLALGGKSLDAVKAAIDSMGKPSGGNRPPVSIYAQPSKVLALAEDPADPNVALARQAFADSGDQFILELLPAERGGRLRIELGEAFFRFFALKYEQDRNADL